MPGTPEPVSAAPDAPRPDTRRRRAFVVVALVAAVLAAVVIAVSQGGGSARDPADGAAVEDAATSAARGEEGTRSFDEVPEELPAGLLTDDASDIEGSVARTGADWSAVLVYATASGRDDVEVVVDAAAIDAGFTRRQASYDDSVKVVFYDGEDGSVLTVTIRGPVSGPLTVGVVRVSP